MTFAVADAADLLRSVNVGLKVITVSDRCRDILILKKDGWNTDPLKYQLSRIRWQFLHTADQSKEGLSLSLLDAVLHLRVSESCQMIDESPY